MTTRRYPQSDLAACMISRTEDDRLVVEAFENHVAVTPNDGYTRPYLMGTAGDDSDSRVGEMRR